jgi:hypothetical protein
MHTLKSDNPEAIGQHCFERAGLGRAPFRVTGFTTMKYCAAPGAPILPGGTCDYCGTAIMYACEITSSDGKTFKVGCDCVNRTGDEGLIRAYKKTPAYRAHQKVLRDAKDEATRAELTRLLTDEGVRARLAASTFTRYDADGRALQDDRLHAIERSLPWCGATGRKSWLSTIRKVLVD